MSTGRAVIPHLFQTRKTGNARIKHTLSLSLSFACCIIFTSALKSQELRLSLLEGKTFGRPVDNYHYTADHYQGFIEGAWRFGLGVSCHLDNSYDVGLVYYHLNTKVPTTFYSPAGTADYEFSMTIRWILVEFVAYLSKKGLRPFLGSDAGIGVLTLKDPASSYRSSRVKFTWGGNLGMDFNFRKLIAIRIKGDVLYSIKLSYPDPPVTSNITAYNTYLQGAVSAGLIFKFKMHQKRGQ